VINNTRREIFAIKVGNTCTFRVSKVVEHDAGLSPISATQSASGR